MTDAAGDQGPETYAEFVAELVRLREAAGTPSFRAMAARSGAVSHATLHQTVTGNRLQPWETVREFVRACDGDEDLFHEHWQRVHRAQTDATEDPETNGGVENDERAADRRPHRLLRRGSRRPVLIGAAVLVVACATALTLTVVDRRDPPAGGSASTPKARKTPTGATVPGDVIRFIDDITYEDGSVVRPGAKFRKVWEVQNVGTIAWRGRYLQRIDTPGETDCRSASRIPIADTRPGERRRIAVTVTAPSTAPTTCKVRWKMVDASGRQSFPSAPPLFYEVYVGEVAEGP